MARQDCSEHSEDLVDRGRLGDARVLAAAEREVGVTRALFGAAVREALRDELLGVGPVALASMGHERA